MYSRVLPDGRNGRDSRELLVDVLEGNVGVGLDAAGAAGPAPGGVPGDCAAAQRVEIGALGARRGGRGAPVVVVDGVGARDQGAPRVARDGGGALVEGRCRLDGSRCGKGARGGQHHGGERSGELHLCCCK
jgi:hypothetical protein